MTPFRPISLEGDLLVIGDDIRETTILNWKTQARAILVHAQDDQGILQVISPSPSSNPRLIFFPPA